ncbi:Detected protein of unknown function [Hibiscus syriacus]|uniref:RING/U-box superfamily protein n=1 Tax=Hibiscus syriacus TaxID=106335 RepID=A0A6A3D042_HIBSY|nr:Detected protein of unknown function [Hibiscus syriacus]
MIIILLHLYTRYLLRRQERRRRAALNLQRTQIAAFYESYIIEPPKSGFDPLVLATLPMFTYKQTTGQVEGHDEPMECSVCLGTITEDSTVRLLPYFQAAEDKELCSMVHPTAPPLMESASIGSVQVGKESEASGSGSASRFGFFRRTLGGERSSRRFQNCGDEIIGTQDLETVMKNIL